MRYVVDKTGLNCFRLVKKALDELYDQLSVSSEEKNTIIQSRLELFRDEYKSLRSGKVPSYNDLFKTYAYTYCYVAAHANIVYNLLSLESSQELAGAFTENEMGLACIGGGPGSDLLGILKFMQQSNKAGSLRFEVYDKEENWTIPLRMWRKLLPDVYKQFIVSGHFATIDVTNPASWRRYHRLWDADLFTISYMMSEVYSTKNEANAFFKSLFGIAKPGSFFLFVDNILVPAHKWFDDLVEEHNQSKKHGHIRLISTSDSYLAQQYSFWIENNECKDDLSPHYGRYYDQFGQVSCPKLKGEVVFRICRKEEER
jgi:hypothetical protein